MSIFDSIGNALGLSGGPQGPQFTPTQYQNSAADALSSGAAYSGAANAATTNPYLSGILGPGGSLQQAEGQATQLQNTGFSLQPQDYQAYGQASNNLARQFGSQESSLANSLSQRGFGGAGSGTAGASFSGLQGNKNEQLAAAQGDIANARMNFAQNALNSTRNAISQLAGVGNQATGQALSGTEAGANAYNQGYGLQNQAAYNSAQLAQQSTTPTLGQAIGGAFTGALSGGLGAVGKGLGTSLGNAAGQSATGGGGGAAASTPGLTGLAMAG